MPRASRARSAAGATRFDTFFLLANPNGVPVQVQATFVREDGKGIVRTICVAPNSRNNIWAQSYPELAGQRFATFLESVASADAACPATAGTAFVAERAVYSGAAFLAGHVNNGTPWTGTIAAPPVAPPFAVASVSPSSGRLGGGQAITITGAGFQQGARVYFDNATWTGDRNANTKLADVDQATSVVVSRGWDDHHRQDAGARLLQRVPDRRANDGAGDQPRQHGDDPHQRLHVQAQRAGVR